MKRMILSTHVGSDGVLSVPLGKAEANREVRVIIEPAGSPHKSTDEWQAWVRSMAGSVTDPTFRRYEQGDYEKREELP